MPSLSNSVQERKGKESKEHAKVKVRMTLCISDDEMRESGDGAAHTERNTRTDTHRLIHTQIQTYTDIHTLRTSPMPLGCTSSRVTSMHSVSKLFR